MVVHLSHLFRHRVVEYEMGFSFHFSVADEAKGVGDVYSPCGKIATHSQLPQLGTPQQNVGFPRHRLAIWIFVNND